MVINGIGLSSIGQKRTQNQDAFLINEEELLFIVSDGMGGYAGGEVASQISVYSISDYLTINKNIPPEQALELAVKQASNAIYDRAQNDDKLSGMGTTTTVLMFKDGDAYIAQVGDSRAYFAREGSLWQVTEDHSLVNEQIKAGRLNRSESKKYRFKNVITRSVGFHRNVEPDVYKMAVEPNDIFLLCSDGLSNYFEDDELQSVLTSKNIEDSAKFLISEANARGGDDNITVLLVDVEKIK